MNEPAYSSVGAPQRSYRLKLWTFFAATLCFAVGLSIGITPNGKQGPATFMQVLSQSDWYVALLASAAAAIVVGLGQEVVALATQPTTGADALTLQPTVIVEIIWRVLLIALLAVCLGVQLAVQRGLLELPQNGLPLVGRDVLTMFAFPLGIMIAMSTAFASARAAQRSGRRWIGALAIAGGAVIVLYVTVNQQTLIVYLVHIACAGVDMANKDAISRYQVDTIAKQTMFANLAKAAMVAYGMAALLLADALRRRGRSRVRRLEAGCGAIFLAAAAVYCVWYYTRGLPMASPDLAEAHYNSYLRWGGLVLGVMAVSVGAYRNARSEDARASVSRPLPLHETPFCLAFLLGATVMLVVDAVRSYSEYQSTFGGVSNLEFAGDLAGNPETQMRVALALATLAACWRAWKLRGLPNPMEISRLDLGRLAATWITLAALLAVGVHTLAAFGFAIWMGPWYIE
jgi:hypothetical protein